MHMADALISPAVGGAFWAVSAGLIGYCCKKVKSELSDSKVPLMGVTGAFIFAAQMINFTIPGTGSSGHLGGGMILAILLGPWAGFLVMASILTVQALFFADGGILALGCNILNLGFWTCLVAYPLIYKKMCSSGSLSKISTAAILASIIGLQLGAFSVVLQTVLSGISELPFAQFLMAMQPIHLGIGIVEGIITAGVVTFVAKAQPQLLEVSLPDSGRLGVSIKFVAVVLLVAAVVIGGAISWFASAHPDGLEWSMFKTSGSEELDTPENPVYENLSGLQKKTAFMPDYDFKETGTAGDESAESEGRWPAVDTGTTVAGLVGGLMTLIIAFSIGLLLKLKLKPQNPATA